MSLAWLFAMDKGTFFACLIMLTEGASSISYLLDGDWKRSLIWLSYTVATLAITL